MIIGHNSITIKSLGLVMHIIPSVNWGILFQVIAYTCQVLSYYQDQR